MPNSSSVSEFDFLAYADGVFDDDPGWKARIEERLRESPDGSARVQAYRAQTVALRRAYAHRIDEPVPRRLYDALNTKRNRSPWHLSRAAVAAVVVLTSVVGVSGWLLGRSDRTLDSGWMERDFVRQSYLGYVNAGDAPSTKSSRTVTLTFSVPDLAHLGFFFAGKKLVVMGSHRMVRLDYAASDGRAFSLFLRPRPNAEISDPRVTIKGDVSLAYWLDGSVASAVVARLSATETLAIAQELRNAAPDSLFRPLEDTPSKPLLPAARGRELTIGAMSFDGSVSYPPPSAPLPEGTAVRSDGH